MDEPDINAPSQLDLFLAYRKLISDFHLETVWIFLCLERQLKKEQNLRYRQRIAGKYSSNETDLVYTTGSFLLHVVETMFLVLSYRRC